MVMITAFPSPPPLVTHALARLWALRNGDPSAVAGTDSIENMARPWEPATCGERLREQIWWWCDDVAAWINHEYCWRTGQLIPVCWPAHPHIVHELPVLACLRAEADLAIEPAVLEAWHRDVLPGFLDRMTARLGESGCRTGTHTDWPAAARHGAYHSEAAIDARQRAFYADTHRSAAGRPPQPDGRRPRRDSGSDP